MVDICNWGYLAGVIPGSDIRRYPTADELKLSCGGKSKDYITELKYKILAFATSTNLADNTKERLGQYIVALNSLYPPKKYGGGNKNKGTKKAPKPKRQTRKKMNRISLGGNVYSKNEFLRVMHQQHADKIYWRMKGDKIIPPGKIKKADLEGWMTFSGAHFI